MGVHGSPTVYLAERFFKQLEAIDISSTILDEIFVDQGFHPKRDVNGTDEDSGVFAVDRLQSSS